MCMLPYHTHSSEPPQNPNKTEKKIISWEFLNGLDRGGAPSELMYLFKAKNNIHFFAYTSAPEFLKASYVITWGGLLTVIHITEQYL